MEKVVIIAPDKDMLPELKDEARNFNGRIPTLRTKCKLDWTDDSKLWLTRMKNEMGPLLRQCHSQINSEYQMLHTLHVHASDTDGYQLLIDRHVKAMETSAAVYGIGLPIGEMMHRHLSVGNKMVSDVFGLYMGYRHIEAAPDFLIAEAMT